MNKNRSFLSFGTYLRNIREEKGITLKDVSGETKIRVDILLLIERENHDQLPCTVFVKGFVRAYAKAVGADEKEALRMYLSSFNIFSGHVQKQTKRSEQKKFWRTLLISSGILLCIILVSIYCIYAVYDIPSDDNEKKQKVSDFSEGESGTQVDHFLKQREMITPGKKNFRLEIVTIKKTWVKVMIDNLTTKEYSLNPGDRVELEAKFDFNILAGNAAGVKLFLNENPVVLSGKSGQVISIQLP